MQLQSHLTANTVIITVGFLYLWFKRIFFSFYPVSYELGWLFF